MKRPNYYDYMRKKLSERNLVYFVEPMDGMYKLYMGFAGFPLKDIEERGSIIYAMDECTLYKQACEMLSNGGAIMI